MAHGPTKLVGNGHELYKIILLNRELALFLCVKTVDGGWQLFVCGYFDLVRSAKTEDSGGNSMRPHNDCVLRSKRCKLAVRQQAAQVNVLTRKRLRS